MRVRLILCCVLLAACGPLAGKSAPQPAREGKIISEPQLLDNVRFDTTRWVDSTLASLTPRQRVAQMVMFWTLGDYTASDDTNFTEVNKWIEDEGVGGITMSLGTPIEVAEKLNYWQSRSKIPLLVAADLEPSLMRLESATFTHYLLETGGATSFPPQMGIAATARDSDAYDVARVIAQEGRAVGIHINFAPVVDVNINPNNPVIGVRSFGEDPDRVARLGALFVRGTKDGGEASTAKHFPGHGDTDVDSHVGLPVVRADMDRLRAIELKPFAAAIHAGVDLVMSAHVALPALGGDSTTPATLRPDVMHALLRDTLGFRGIAITDALSMQGIGKGFGIDEAVVRAVQAGTDILLRPVSGDQHANDVSRALDAVLAGIQRGDLTQARIDSSVQRILWLKARLGLLRQRYVSTDSLRAVVATAPHKALSLDVAQRSLTLIRDSANAIPLAANARVAIVNYMPETELKAGRVFAKEFTRLHPSARVVAKVTPASLTMQLDSVAKLVKNADVVVIATYVRRVEGEGRNTIPPLVASWIDSLATQPNVAVVSFGNPYSIRQFPRARVYLNAYGVGDVLEVAVARALNGAAPIGGKSPVSLPGFFKLGDGLTR